MSTDHQLKPRAPEPRHDPPPKANKFDLSVTKIVGGALAAMTAAAIGSRLSVAGTVIGAALASVVAAVGSSLYTASLKHTQQKVRTVFSGRVGDHGADAVGLPTSVETRSPTDDVTSAYAPAQPSAPGWASAGAVQPTANVKKADINVKGIVIGALAVFAIAAAVLTGFELISGHALSGGKGTTITQVSGGSKPTPTKKPTPTATPRATESARPSETATSTPEPSQEVSRNPAATPSTPTASRAPTPTSSSPPSASATGGATPAPSAGMGTGAGAGAGVGPSAGGGAGVSPSAGG